MPSEQLLAEMGKYNEELVKAGVLVAAEGLHPTSKGVFGPEFTPELREAEQRLRESMERSNG